MEQICFTSPYLLTKPRPRRALKKELRGAGLFFYSGTRTKSLEYVCFQVLARTVGSLSQG